MQSDTRARAARGPNIAKLSYLFLGKAFGHPLKFIDLLSAQYGDIATFRFREKPDYLLLNPLDIEKVLLAPEDKMARSTPPALKRLLKNGLLTSQGEFHKLQRKAIQPVFHKNRIDAMAQPICDCSAALRDSWRDGEEVNICHAMKMLSMNIVLKAMFNLHLEPNGIEKLSRAVDVVQEIKNKNDVPVIRPILDLLPLTRNKNFKTALSVLDEAIADLIMTKRRELTGPTDFISTLLFLQKTSQDPRYSDAQIHDEVMTIFAAGHETISNALSWTWYLLSQNPQSEQLLTKELDGVLAGQTPRPEDLDKLVYTRMVFKEAMRIFPPVWLIGRRPVQDFDLDGITLPQGSFIHISPYRVHHDSRFYNDPERFWPERWEAASQKTKRQFTYFPFGGGTRLCVGEEFAWTEGILVLATLAQRFRVRLMPGQNVAPDLCITLRPKHDIQMKLEDRQIRKDVQWQKN